MLSKLISSDALAIILDGGDIENDYIIYEINRELLSAGIKPWPGFEAEVFVNEKQTLVIARPFPPLCTKGFTVRIRRKR